MLTMYRNTIHIREQQPTGRSYPYMLGLLSCYVAGRDARGQGRRAELGPGNLFLLSPTSKLPDRWFASKPKSLSGKDVHWGCPPQWVSGAIPHFKKPFSFSDFFGD